MSYIDVDIPYEMKYHQSEFDLTTDEHFFKYEYSPTKYSIFKVPSKREFVQWYNQINPRFRFFYEMLPYDRPVREYYDIDVTGHFTPEELATKSVEYVDTLVSLRNSIASIPCSTRDFIVLEDNRPTKLSLHLISTSTYYRTNASQKQFAKCLNYVLESYNAGFQLDESVYNRNKLFRLMKSCKRKYGSPLRLFRPELYSFAQMEDTFLLLDSTIGLRELKTNLEPVHQSTFTPIQHQDVRPEHVEILRQWLVDHPELEVVNDRLNRVSRTPCFIDPSDTHSTENGHWWVRDNKVYVNCFTHSSPLCINQEDCERIDRDPTPFDHTTDTIDKLQHLSTYGDFKTLLMKLPFGQGKTTRSIEYATEKYSRILIISHRITLIRDMCRRFDFASYCDDDFSSDRLVCCINSLHRLEDPSKYDIVIIDEIHSCLRQTSMKSSDMRLATSFFIQMLKDKSRTVIAMDGNLSNADVVLLKRIRDDPDTRVLYSKRPANKSVFFYQKRDDVEERILSAIRSGKKVAVGFSVSVASIKAFVMREEFIDKNVLVIHKDNRTIQVLDPDYWLNYDIVFYSPTISEGFSFEHAYFDVVCMLMTSLSCPPETCAQQLARVRCTAEVHCFIEVRPSTKKLFNDADEIYDYYQTNVRELHQISTVNIDGVNADFQPLIRKDVFWELFAKNKLELGHDYHSFMETTYQLLIDNGYKVYMYNKTFTSAEKIEENHDLRMSLKAEVQEHEQQQILAAPDITDRELELLENKMNKTEEETYMITRANYKNILNLETLTDTCFEYKSHLGHICHLRQVIVLFRDMKTPDTIQRAPVEQLIRQHADQQLRLIGRDSFDRQQDGITREIWIRLQYLNQWCKQLGFSQLVTSDTVPEEQFHDRLRRLSLYYRSRRAEWTYLQLLFNQQRNIKSWMKFLKDPDEFVRSKFKNTLALELVQLGPVVVQRLMYSISLLRDEPDKPCLFSCTFPSGSPVVEDLDALLARERKWCDTCNKTVYSFNQQHIESVGHQRMLKGTWCAVCEKEYAKGIPLDHELTRTHLRHLQ